MRSILLVGVSAVALALGGCSLFERHNESTQSNAGYTPPASSQAQAAPSTTAQKPATAQAAQPSTGTSAARSGTRADRDAVMQAQQKLQSDGLYKGKVDGIMGPRTKQAVMAFQKQSGLKQTGMLDQQTMAQLSSSSGSGQGSATGTSTPPASSRAPTAGSTGTSGPDQTTGASSSSPSNAPSNSSSTGGTTTK
jgi:peptidoglycan hydrolase-like protein with peptidoglycan-binding domain